jgi:hypothetical protein
MMPDHVNDRVLMAAHIPAGTTYFKPQLPS